MRLETVELDLAPLVAAFGRRLHVAGVPVTAERSARLASALTLTRPVSRTRLYWTARAVLVSDQAQVKAFDRVFFSVFGSRVDKPEFPGEETEPDTSPGDDRPAKEREGRGAAPGIAEAIDWLAALDVLGTGELDPATIDRTLGSVLKYSEDQDVVRTAGLGSLV